MRPGPRTPALLLAAVVLLTGCGSAPVAAPAPSPARTATSAPATTTPAPATTSPTTTAPVTTTAATTTASSAVTTAASCPLPSTGFSCAEQVAITAAEQVARRRPGTTGIVLRDRRTGAVWSNEHASTMVWTASTIKLAMVVDLVTRNGKGLITLTATDRAQIAAMLHSSDDDAADALWYRYAGADHGTWNADFPAYGLTDLTPQRGFSKYYPYWGFQKTTPADLDRLIHYVLTELDATDRAFIVQALQHVAPDQQWGVWGAGPALEPGNKDGWSLEQGGWVINSVGFVGPDQRWTLAMMSSLNGEGGYDDGVATLNAVAKAITAGLS